ncbi:hypothetical protein [Nocardia sp. NPDC005978]|uniref:hypothetical protein n=1 Tax=unclassified Nocardia TaxID=2637762 RepID=UPI0033ABC97C
MRRLLLAAAGTAAIVAMISIVIPLAIWPGEAKLTAPLFCSAPYTEPMVVSDTWHDSEGTSTNYTLYCVGERGAYTDEGFARPMLVMIGAHALIVAALVVAIGLPALRRSRPRADTPPGAIEY